MASLGLKIYFLRTRIRKVTQQQLAADLGIRQAAVSQLERDQVTPSVELLLGLCEYFDVSANHLIDEEAGIVPGPADRWSLRNGLVATGMWIEVPAERVRELEDGKSLCPLLADEPFYDDEAAELRAALPDAELEERVRARSREARDLERELQDELRKPNMRRGWRFGKDDESK